MTIEFITRRMRVELLIILLIFLTSCGYHLRGSTTIPKPYRILYLSATAPDPTFMIRVRDRLRSEHVTLVDTPSAAPYTLHIITFTQDTRQTAVSSSARLQQFVISDHVNFEVRDSRGKIILAPTEVQSSRLTSVSTNEMLGSNDQTETVENELQDEVITKMFIRLQMLKP